MIIWISVCSLRVFSLSMLLMNWCCCACIRTFLYINQPSAADQADQTSKPTSKPANNHSSIDRVNQRSWRKAEIRDNSKLGRRRVSSNTALNRAPLNCTSQFWLAYREIPTGIIHCIFPMLPSPFFLIALYHYHLLLVCLTQKGNTSQRTVDIVMTQQRRA